MTSRVTAISAAAFGLIGGATIDAHPWVGMLLCVVAGWLAASVED